MNIPWSVHNSTTATMNGDKGSNADNVIYNVREVDILTWSTSPQRGGVMHSYALIRINRFGSIMGCSNTICVFGKAVYRSFPSLNIWRTSLRLGIDPKHNLCREKFHAGKDGPILSHNNGCVILNVLGSNWDIFMTQDTRKTMLKIQRPLCSDLTFRLTHDISPDLFCEEDSNNCELNREQFLLSCFNKNKDAISEKVKDKLKAREVKDKLNSSVVKRKCDNGIFIDGYQPTRDKEEEFQRKYNQFEHFNNVINQQYHQARAAKWATESKPEETRQYSSSEEKSDDSQTSHKNPGVAKPRKHRRLPEIPTNQRKSSSSSSKEDDSSARAPPKVKCLADELQEALLRETQKPDSDDEVFESSVSHENNPGKIYPKFSSCYLDDLKKINFNSVSKNTRPFLASNNVYLAEDSTDESKHHLAVATGERRRRNSSGDSSRRKSTSSAAGTPYQDLDVTHRGMHRFIPRHKDEMTIEIGDPIHVFTEADDLWCEGVNLRTFQRGIFPSMYATDLQFLEEDDSEVDGVSRFSMQFMGSVEVNEHKGDDVICQAINKVALSRRSTKTSANNSPPPMCTLEVSQYGIRMFDKSKDGHEDDTYTHFFALKNISFCGFHPRNERYFAFITKHPKLYRFACHVFLGTKSTRSVSDALGNAFKRFYQEYMAFTHPTEDIYME